MGGAVVKLKGHGLEALQLIQQMVARIHLGLETVFVQYELVAKHVVKMKMSAEQMFRRKPILVNIGGKGFFFFLLKASAVYYDAFFGIVAEDVGVLMHQVDAECGYPCHLISRFGYRPMGSLLCRQA